MEGLGTQMWVIIGLSRILGRLLFGWITDIVRFLKWYYTPDESEKARWDSISPRAAMIARFFRVIF